MALRRQWAWGSARIGDMSNARKKADWPVVAAVLAALVLVPLGMYVGGYFAMAKRREFTGPIERRPRVVVNSPTASPSSRNQQVT